MESIDLDETSDISVATKKYHYNANGIQNPLIRELTENPFRFSMSSELVPVSQNPIGIKIQAQFAKNGIKIDSNANATTQDSKSWLITDTLNQQLFVIKKTEQQLMVYDGGESYQLHNYQFWKILYYPPFEKWLIVKESGMNYTFGGRNNKNVNKNGFKTSTGNSVQWAVCWTDPNNPKKAIWTGSSGLCSNNCQKQYAKSWALSSITDRFGDQVKYAYNQFGADGTYRSYSDQWRDTTADLLPVVEQKVGATGLPYTKAQYLTSITDSFNRKITFNYGDKAYTAYTNSKTATKAREYLDPHQDLAQQVIASDPKTYPKANAYQDTYETKFLQSIDVKSDKNHLLFSIGFTYQTVTDSFAGYDSENRLYGDTVKRQLSGITQYNEHGESLLQSNQPELYFRYISASGQNPGALKSITYPDGAIASYHYEEQHLDVCNRQITITPPQVLGDMASPRIFYGKDYVVSLWTDASLTKLSMRVYTWLGHWKIWEINDVNNGSLIYDNPDGSIHVSGKSRNLLNVHTGEHYFVVSFSDGQKVQAYVFAKNNAHPGQWTPYESKESIHGKTIKTSCNHPSASWKASSTVSIYSGGSWFLALEKNSAQKNTLYRFTYRWAKKSADKWLRHNWQSEKVVTQQAGSLYIGTNSDCYITLRHANNSAEVSLNYLDNQLKWHNSDNKKFDNMIVHQQNNALISMGQSFAVFSNQTRNPSSSHIYYDVRLFQWNVEYKFIDVKWNDGKYSTTSALSLQDQIGRKDATPSIVPHIKSNALFACAGNVFRFDGKTWWSRTADDGLAVNRNARYLHFTYGEDHVIQGWVDNKSPKGRLLSYDPNNNGGAYGWDNKPVEVKGLPISTPSYDPENSNWVTSGKNDFISIGDNIYYRGCSADWDTQINKAGYVIKPDTNFQINTAAIGNQAPGFITYFEYKKGAMTGSTVAALLLKNGQVYNKQSFSGQRYYTTLENTGSRSAGNGLNPTGSNSLVTYPDTAAKFQETQKIYLYRYAGEALTGNITHRPVTRISIDDGFGQVINTAYYYDKKTATCDANGHIIKYYETYKYPGCSTPDKQRNGYKKQQYINGLASLTISNLNKNCVVSWNDGSTGKKFTATQDPDTFTINNVNNTILQSLTLNTPSHVTLNFLYGTKAFAENYNKTNIAVPLFNHIPEPPINYFQMLDGMLCRTDTYKSTTNGFQQIASQTNKWQPYTERAGNLNDSSIVNTPLNGGLVLQTEKHHCNDGTEKTEKTSYIPPGFSAPTTGQPFEKSIKYYNGNGKQVIKRESISYGYQFYPSMRNLHLFNTVVQKVTKYNDTVTSASADVYADTSNLLKVSVPAKSASFKYSSEQFSAFPFNTYDSEQPKSWQGWLRTNLINITNPNGLVVSSQDATGINHSLLYDKNNQFTVASISNAFFQKNSQDSIVSSFAYGNGGAIYCGFESYENMSLWHLFNGAVIDSPDRNSVSNCHTGENSLKIPPNAYVKTQVDITKSNENYLIGFWYKTDTDFTNKGLQITFEIPVDTTPALPYFSATNGKWVFQTVGITDKINNVGTIIVTLKNKGNSDINIDDFFIMPMQAELGSHVYDPQFMYVTATHESPGRTSRLLRNRFHQLTSHVAYNNQITDLTIHGYSRSTNTTFNDNQPNAKITLKAAAGGVYADFRDGGNYAKQFSFTHLLNHWKTQDDSIVHNNASVSDSITSLAFSADLSVETVAMYLELKENLESKINKPLSLSIGEFTFTWTPSDKTWTGIGPMSINCVKQRNNPRNILLMRGKGIIVLCADGHLIGSYPTDVSDQIFTFNTGNNIMKISNLMVLANPRLKIDYYDATSKTVQTQQLLGQDSYVTQAIHDECGRDAVVCKALPFSFQNNHTKDSGPQQILEYRKGLLNAPDFLQSLQGNGVLRGDIADFYTGESKAVKQWQTQVKSWNNPASYSFTPSNDKGYPYSRKLYEASPLGRVIEKGQPGCLTDGTLLAIDMTKNRNSRHTIQYQFGSIDGEFTLPAPFITQPCGYQITSEIQPLKSRKVQIKDLQGDLVSSVTYNAGSKIARSYDQHYDEFYSYGIRKIHRLPNYFSQDPDRHSSNFITVLNANVLGLTTSKVETDTRTTLYLYDSLGRLRFEMPDQTDQDNKYIKYTCYDALSHVMRNGTIDAEKYYWNKLHVHLDDQNWPKPEDSNQTRVINYGDLGTAECGPDTNQLGQISSVITNNYRTIGADDITFIVTEKFKHNISATIASVNQCIEESLNNNRTIIGPAEGYTVKYHYNNLDQVSDIIYPKNLGETLSYRYDEIGREVYTEYNASSQKNQGLMAQYHYTCGEKLSQMDLNSMTDKQTSHQITDTQYNYTSSELLSNGTNMHQQNIGIGVGDYKYNADGHLISCHLDFKTQKSNSKETHQYHIDKDFSYDESVKRLSSSSDTKNPDTNISHIKYDDNGNILQLNQAGTPVHWTFKDNNSQPERSDLLASISTSNVSITYDPSGKITQAPHSSDNKKANVFTYDNSLHRVATVTNNGKQATYVYGSQGQRVLKRTDHKVTNRIIYISPGSHHLAETTVGDDASNTNYIYSNNHGLLGITQNGQNRFPVSDQTGTVMAWLDHKGHIISQYKFLPFGEIHSQDLFAQGCPVIYAGQPYETDIGLYNFRDRLYDPRLRRFITADPKRQFPSPYVYAGNNPISNVDSNGQWSANAIGGLILSIAEIGLAIGSLNYWAIPIGVTGMTNSISHKDDKGKSFWKNYAQSEIGTVIGVGEVAAGVALTVFTDGAGGSWGGATLIGAGVSAISYSTFHEGDFDWNAYAKAQVVGAVGGFITGGFGAAAGALPLTGATMIAAEMAMGATAGVASSLAGSAITAAWDHQSINWKSALLNAGISGALGIAGVGASRLAKGTFTRVTSDLEASANPIPNENTPLLGNKEVSGWKKFAFGKTGDLFNRNTAREIIPNPNRIVNLAKPATFNLKKPIISAIHDYKPHSKEWI